MLQLDHTHNYCKVQILPTSWHHWTTSNATWPETERYILTNWLKPFFRILCAMTIQKPFWRNLSMRFGLWWKIKKQEWKICFFDHSFAHIFFFSFCRKNHSWFLRKYDVFSDCSKIQQLQLSFEGKKFFFHSTGSWPEVGQAVTPQNVTIDAKCNINAKCNNFGVKM